MTDLALPSTRAIASAERRADLTAFHVRVLTLSLPLRHGSGARWLFFTQEPFPHSLGTANRITIEVPVEAFADHHQGPTGRDIYPIEEPHLRPRVRRRFHRRGGAERRSHHRGWERHLERELTHRVGVGGEVGLVEPGGDQCGPVRAHHFGSLVAKQPR